jgi:hypothetical protein
MGCHLGEAFPLKFVEFLVLQGLADLDHPVRSEIEDDHCVTILHPRNWRLDTKAHTLCMSLISQAARGAVTVILHVMSKYQNINKYTILLITQLIFKKKSKRNQ